MSIDQEVIFTALQKRFGDAPEDVLWILRPRFKSQWLVHKKDDDESVGECGQRENGEIFCIFRGIEGTPGNTPLEAVANGLKAYKASKYYEEDQEWKKKNLDL